MHLANSTTTACHSPEFTPQERAVLEHAIGFRIEKPKQRCRATDIALQVGLAVAMGNAVPELRAVADVVVGTNDEEGVAEAIERFVLEPLGALASA